MPKPKHKPEMVQIPLTALVRWVRQGQEINHCLRPGTVQFAMANALWMDIMAPMTESGYDLLKKLDEEKDNPFS